jgi:hypothetical protein
MHRGAVGIHAWRVGGVCVHPAAPPASATNTRCCALSLVQQVLLTAPEAERIVEKLEALDIEEVGAWYWLAAGRGASRERVSPVCNPIPNPNERTSNPEHRKQYGSPKFLEQHDWITQLNLQAHHNVNAHCDEFVVEALVSRGKVDVLVHNLLVAEVRYPAPASHKPPTLHPERRTHSSHPH